MDARVKVRLVVWRVGAHGSGAGAGRPARVLTDDGLATRLGDRVGCSRAAVRFDALSG